MLRMARRHAVVQRLAAVETLGATSVVCTDKTGTLTKNELTVSRLWLSDGIIEIQHDGIAARDGRQLTEDEMRRFRDLLTVGVLCNNATLHEDGTSVGDSLEIALLKAAAGAEIQRARLVEEMPEVREEAFDTDTKMMATIHESGAGGHYVAVKGAPEAVIGASVSVRDEKGNRDLDAKERDAWQQRVDELALEGIRVLAHADKTDGRNSHERRGGLQDHHAGPQHRQDHHEESRDDGQPSWHAVAFEPRDERIARHRNEAGNGERHQQGRSGAQTGHDDDKRGCCDQRALDGIGQSLLWQPRLRFRSVDRLAQHHCQVRRRRRMERSALHTQRQHRAVQL
jgi:hypothetical protein